MTCHYLIPDYRCARDRLMSICLVFKDVQLAKVMLAYHAVGFKLCCRGVRD